MMLVVSYGGSIIAPEDIDAGFIERIAECLMDTKEEAYIVVGGGEIARKYIEKGRELGANESLLDEIGILATRMNAYLLLCALGNDAYPRVAETINEAITAEGRRVVMGGTVPGHTTDAVAALLAERLDSKKLILATSVDGVYTSDPKLDKNAKKIKELKASELVAIVTKNSAKAGSKSVVDLLGARVIERSGMECWIFDGRNLEGFKRALEGERKGFCGSIVH
jgi:uridylate kinase